MNGVPSPEKMLTNKEGKNINKMRIQRDFLERQIINYINVSKRFLLLRYRFCRTHEIHGLQAVSEAEKFVLKTRRSVVGQKRRRGDWKNGL